jgi:hypothetical protein
MIDKYSPSFKKSNSPRTHVLVGTRFCPTYLVSRWPVRVTKQSELAGSRVKADEGSA